MSQLHVWREADRQVGDKLIVSAKLECGSERDSLIYSLPVEHALAVTESLDPFVVACMLMAMRKEAKMIVHGSVSRSLLVNLSEWQAAWHCWLPEKYHLISIECDEESEQRKEGRSGLAVAAFTGGIDSSFTIARHCREASAGGRMRRTIEAGVLVHGFDIPLADSEAFNRACAKARETLASVGVRLIEMSSNHKELNHEWNDTHGIGIMSCLMLLSRRYSEGIVASTYPYNFLYLPWGSNPVTDRLLSSDSFEVIHDGAHTGRPQKALVLSQWPEAWRNLRFCYSAERKDENCGNCAKCISTALGLMAAKIELPPSFPGQITRDRILAMTNLADDERDMFELILEKCKRTGVTGDWVQALERCLENSRRRRHTNHAGSSSVQKLKALGLRTLLAIRR